MRCLAHSPAKPSGFTFAELTVALAILGMVIVVAAQLLAAAAVQRRGVERRSLALLEAANLMERIAAVPFDELDSTRVEQYALSARTQSCLPESQLSIHVQSKEEGEIRFKMVTVEIGWLSSGQPARPVQLTAWRAAPTEDSL
jgi:prepilin-type N-terminal cleavage/methylation domain-containing protein